MMPSMSTNAPTPARQPPPACIAIEVPSTDSPTSASHVGHRGGIRSTATRALTALVMSRTPCTRSSTIWFARASVEVGAVGLHRTDLHQRRVVGRGVLDRHRAAREVEVERGEVPLRRHGDDGARRCGCPRPRPASPRPGRGRSRRSARASTARATGVGGHVLVDRAAEPRSGVADVVLREVADAWPRGRPGRGHRGGTARPSVHGASRSAVSPDVGWTRPVVVPSGQRRRTLSRRRRTRRPRRRPARGPGRRRAARTRARRRRRGTGCVGEPAERGSRGGSRRAGRRRRPRGPRPQDDVGRCAEGAAHVPRYRRTDGRRGASRHRASRP